MDQIKHIFNMIWLLRVIQIQLKKATFDKVLSDKLYLQLLVVQKNYGCQAAVRVNGLYIFDKKCSHRRGTYVYLSSFMDNIWGVGGGGGDPTDMQLMSRCRRAILLLLRVIDVFSKYEWAIALKD